MSKHRNRKKTNRDAREEQQARRIVNGIFAGLIVLMLLSLVAYHFWQS